MILALLLALASSPARADAVRFTDGAMIYGSVVGMTGDTVEIIVAKDQFDADDWEKARATPHPGFLVLRDGTVLRAVDATLSDASADLRIPRAQIAGVDTSAAAPTAPVLPPPVAPAAPAAVPPATPPATPPAAPPAAPPVPPLPAAVPGFTPAPTTGAWTLAPNPNSVGVDGGVFIPVSRLTIEGSDVVAGPGYAFGVQYLHRTERFPVLEFGAGVEDVTGGANASGSLIPGFTTTTQLSSLMGLALARVSTDLGRYRLRLLGGVGMASTNLKVDVSQTNGSQSLNLVNSTRSSAVLMLRPEIDDRLTDSVWCGLSFSYFAFASATYGASAEGQSLGLESINGSFSGIALSGNLYVKF